MSQDERGRQDLGIADTAHMGTFTQMRTALLDEVYEMAAAGPSRKATHDAHDYTEGASAMDIDDIVARNRRTRRDSQYSSLYGDDGEGAMFDGPGHTVNPSSVSRMSYK